LGRSQQNLAWVGGLSSGLMVLVSGLTLWLVLWVVIPLVNAGLFDGVALAVIALVTMASFEAVNPLGQAAQQLESSLQAARRLFALVDAEPEVRAPLQPCSHSPASALHVRALSFRYQPGLPYALQDIDFDLPTGKRIALAGPSGAGKSTLVNLLLRFWDYSEGEIRLGGCDLRQLDPEVVRQRFGVVSQRTYLFGGTLQDNLLLARPDASEEQMWQALRRAGLQLWVQGLPSQLDTWIGERGLQISAGERQRLAVARCILQDASILLLDEPTANLDAHTEARVLASLNVLMKDRSVLWITHRLVGMEAVDEIIVLDGGCIVQRGRHKDLLQQPGLYQRMWTLQNRIILDR
jgi:ABC-type multidrug transport system fused ATPase/permease subunit